MAASSASRYFMALFLLNTFLKLQAEDPKSMSFDFKNFGEDSHFESQLALYGDAKVVNGSMSIQISTSMVSMSGEIIYEKPFKFVAGNSRKMVSFATHFVFSMSREIGDGLAFVMIPNEFPLNGSKVGLFGQLGESKVRFLAVKFDTLSNQVGIDVNSLVSVKVSNISSINLLLNSGERLQCWIDYEAGSNRLEVRLSKLDESRTVGPLLSHPIDLSQMWKEEEVFVGINSLSTRNLSQACNVYSWSFRTRTVPQWMHSEPLDLETFREKGGEVDVHKRSNCSLKILAALMLVTGCGALGAFIALLLWTIFGSRRPVVPHEFAMQTKEIEDKKEFEHKRSNIAVNNTIEEGHN